MGIDFNTPTPLYRQIADDIKARIASGQMKVGDQLGSQQELAREYSVSLITVKKALADLIHEGVLFSRVGKGTYVAARKRVAIDLSRHKTIGLVLRDLKSPFFSLILHSVEEKASEKGYNLLLSNSGDRLDKEESQIRHFRQIGVSGLIIASMSRIYQATNTIRKLHQENFPYVFVSYMEDEDIFYVGTDHEYGAHLATEHLIKLGHNKIGYISGEEGNLLSELRKKGYLRALQQYGKPFEESLVFRSSSKGEGDDYQSGYEIGLRFLALAQKPDAVFAYKDLAALGFQQALLDQGLKVPHDVAIVGFDDIESGRYAPVPLTTIHQPTAEIGAIAVETLIKRIEGKEANIRTILKPTLVVRESCGAKLRSISRKISYSGMNA
ncbi:MAG: GntR family transcriptional regulator [candidate division KSB1 bacterium]|nr:GntR family transcriptional regulator [candidate division KSB1 bacterium]MDZ7305388.1 GntR family transcriptional regulator [candidate division KSB1 bacterium]MDZ7312962.1 GntR family transcriptional regulator [candidate division KSB1 bacterium]